METATLHIKVACGMGFFKFKMLVIVMMVDTFSVIQYSSKGAVPVELNFHLVCFNWGC